MNSDLHKGGKSWRLRCTLPTRTFDLISVAYHALQGAETYEQYIRDAEGRDDQEAAQYFRDLQGKQV